MLWAEQDAVRFRPVDCYSHVDWLGCSFLGSLVRALRLHSNVLCGVTSRAPQTAALSYLGDLSSTLYFYFGVCRYAFLDRVPYKSAAWAKYV